MDQSGWGAAEGPGGDAGGSGRASIWRMAGWVAGALGVIYGGYEVLERTWFGAAEMKTLHTLHLLRGLSASVVVAVVVTWYLLRSDLATFPSQHKDEEGGPAPLDLDERYREYALWFVQMRWTAVAISAALVVLTVPVTELLPLSVLPILLGWIAVLAVANWGFGRWARSGSSPERQILIQVLVDLVVLTGLLNASGGIENPLYLAYLFQVIIGAILLPRLKAFWVTVAAASLFLLLAAGEYSGLFPHYTNVLFPHGVEGHQHSHGEHDEGSEGVVHAAHDPLFVIGRTVPFVAVLALTAHLTMLVAGRLRRSEESLAGTARRALMERRRLESVVQAAGLGMVLYDRQLSVRWINPQAKRWLAAAGEPGGDEGRDGREERRQALLDCLASGRAREMERSVTARSGALRYLRHAVSPIRREEGRVVQVVELIEDVTERKLLEAEALHAGKLSALGQMAAGVAHEIGNPLSSLKTRLHLMERHREPEFLEESFALLQAQLDRIGRIVRGVSEFARDRGEEWSEWQLDAAVDEALSVVRLDRRAKGVVFRRRGGGALVVRGVRDQMVQVVLNLLLNAVQAMEGGGEVVVETALRDGSVAVIVQDSGPGMSEEMLRRLFEPFFTTRPDGSGLGLSISYSLVHAHGGSIEVASREGHGARFTVLLPALDRGEA